MTDYLWDPSQKPDPEVQRLESLLGGLKYDRPLEAAPSSAVQPAGPSRRHGRFIVILGAAAVVLVALGAVLFLRFRGPGPGGDTLSRGLVTGTDPRVSACRGGFAPNTSWAVTALAGRPKCQGISVSRGARLLAGAYLETDGSSRAKIDVADIGEVLVDHNSRIELLVTGRKEHRMVLARGRIRATIDAPPRLFLVETPSAMAVDMGCEYTLTVDGRGNSHLHVLFGLVALERKGKSIEVFAGMKADTRKGFGLGIPYAATATPKFRAAVLRLAFERDVPDNVHERLLSAAGPADAFTLWHLLARGTAAQREKVYLRLRQLNPPPAGVTKALILAKDKKALSLWRTALVDRWRESTLKPTRKNPKSARR